MSFHSNLPNNFGDFHVGVYNGEGYSQAEANDQKAFQFRVTVRPMARSSSIAARGLRVTGFYDADNYIKSGAEEARRCSTRRSSTSGSTRASTIWRPGTRPCPAVSLVPGKGWSFWVTPFFKEKGNGWEALIRYDAMKPNTANTTQRQTAVDCRPRLLVPASGRQPDRGIAFRLGTAQVRGLPGDGGQCDAGEDFRARTHCVLDICNWGSGELGTWGFLRGEMK